MTIFFYSELTVREREALWRLRTYCGLVVRPQGHRIDGNHIDVRNAAGQHATLRVADLGEATEEQAAEYEATEVQQAGTWGDIEWPADRPEASTGCQFAIRETLTGCGRPATHQTDYSFCNVRLCEEHAIEAIEKFGKPVVPLN